MFVLMTYKHSRTLKIARSRQKRKQEILLKRARVDTLLSKKLTGLGRRSMAPGLSSGRTRGKFVLSNLIIIFGRRGTVMRTWPSMNWQNIHPWNITKQSTLRLFSFYFYTRGKELREKHKYWNIEQSNTEITVWINEADVSRCLLWIRWRMAIQRPKSMSYF